jgi:hypothetical protein
MSEQLQSQPVTILLSALIERFQSDGSSRDELFVRRFSQWLHENSRQFRLDLIEQMALTDVVVTFQMKGRVTLIVTGYLPGSLPGEVTVKVDERDFVDVNVSCFEGEQPDPYEICTLDYGPAGAAVEVISGPLNGQCGVLLVAATVGAQQQNRIQLESGEIVTLDGEVLQFVD